jgi:hypothetical protein
MLSNNSNTEWLEAAAILSGYVSAAPSLPIPSRMVRKVQAHIMIRDYKPLYSVRYLNPSNRQIHLEIARYYSLQGALIIASDVPVGYRFLLQDIWSSESIWLSIKNDN